MSAHGLRRAYCAIAAAAAIVGGLAQPAHALSTASQAAEAQRLIRHSYPVAGTAAALLTSDDAAFHAFSAKVRDDFDRDFAVGAIEDHGFLRELLAIRLSFEVLSGSEDRAALATVARIRELEDKPDAKLLSGLQMEAILKARLATGKASGPAFQDAFAANLAVSLASLPWPVVANRVKQDETAAQMTSKPLVLGLAKTQLDAALTQSHALSSVLAWQVVQARRMLNVDIPVGQATAKILANYISAHGGDSPDIWRRRDITLADSDKLTPVNVAIWDSGSDLSLFPNQLYTDPSPSPWFDAHGLAFDLHGDPTHGDIVTLDAPRTRQYAQMRGELKGMSDSEADVASPEADAFKAKLAAMRPDQLPTYLETLNFFTAYVHGTHVAGIAAQGNPAIRLIAARMTIDWRNVPEAPTEAQARRDAENFHTFVGWFRDHDVRVVNMSWGETPAEIAQALEKNGVGKDEPERLAMVKKLFLIDAAGLYQAIRSAPEILFVCAAGNSNANSTTVGAIPAAFKLPNLLTVGAVDQAGDEASFTNYGDTVRVDADGYQVESVLPGGDKVRFSGTSMAAPMVANLAAKLLAVDPDLAPPQVIKLIVDGATPSADGRRHNINPRRSMELLKALPRPASYGGAG